MAATGRVLEMLEHCVQVERSGLLTRRELFKSLYLLGDERLHPVDDIGVGNQPIPIGVRVFIRPLERIAAKVEHLRRSELHERLEPAHELLGPLLHEHDLPVAHADRQDVAVIADVKEELPRTFFRLAGQVGDQVVAVDMDLVGLFADLVPLRSLSLISGSPAAARNVGSHS